MLPVAAAGISGWALLVGAAIAGVAFGALLNRVIERRRK